MSQKNKKNNGEKQSFLKRFYLLLKENSFLLSWIFFILISLISILTHQSKYFANNNQNNVKNKEHSGKLFETLSQIKSFFEEYSLDDNLVAKERENNLKNYNFKYGKIDRRSKLSLQEFYDVYDGKW